MVVQQPEESRAGSVWSFPQGSQTVFRLLSVARAWVELFLGDANKSYKCRYTKEFDVIFRFPAFAHLVWWRVRLQTPGGGGKGGGDASRNERPRSKIDDRRVQRNERKEEENEANSKLVTRGGIHTTTEPDSLLVLPHRKGEVLDVPHGLLG